MIKQKLDRLLDAHLDGALELSEYQLKKNDLMNDRADLEGKLNALSRKGDHWLEPMRAWILSANQAATLAETEKYNEMCNFLKSAGSNHTIADQKYSIVWQSPWDYLAQARTQLGSLGLAPSGPGAPAHPSAGSGDARFSVWWTWWESDPRLKANLQ